MLHCTCERQAGLGTYLSCVSPSCPRAFAHGRKSGRKEKGRFAAVAVAVAVGVAEVADADNDGGMAVPSEDDDEGEDAAAELDEAESAATAAASPLAASADDDDDDTAVAVDTSAPEAAAAAALIDSVVVDCRSAHSADNRSRNKPPASVPPSPSYSTRNCLARYFK